MTSEPVNRRRSVDRGPARLSHAVSVLSAVLGVAATGWYSRDALLVGTAGLLVVVASLLVYRRRGVDVGALALFAGVVVAGTTTTPVWALLVGVAGATVAWDAGENALSLGAQVGRESPSRRAEAVHLAGTLSVVALAAGGGYWVYLAATGGQPATALVLLLLAAALVVAWLSE